jgi:hypothetical protein
MRALAITPATSCNLPACEVPPAMLAGPRACAFGMVVGILVERDTVERMHITEDVATASTVVPAGEVAEVALAGCFVTDCGFGIGLLRGKSVRRSGQVVRCIN